MPSVRSMYKKVPTKGKKKKIARKQFLPSLYDDHFTSPRDGMLQYNTEFRRRPKFNDIDGKDAGYDTEVKEDRNLMHMNTAEEAFNTGSVDGAGGEMAW